MRITKLSSAIGLVVALSLSLPASAEPPAPQIVDAAGDANFLNAQGNTASAPSGGPDTRPASLDGADLRSIRLHTRYWTVRMYNEDGSLQKIDYRPMALQVDITTTGPIKPTMGPSLQFILPTVIDGCEVWFQGFVRSPLAQPNPPWPGSADPERLEIRKLNLSGQPVCAGGAVTMTSPAFQYMIADNVMTMMFPFEAFSGAMAGFIKNGTDIGQTTNFINASRYPSVRTVHYTPTAPVVGSAGLIGIAVVDEAPRFTSFKVGSDVPADVICESTPEHAECVAE